MLHERVRIETPADPTPAQLVDIIVELTKQLPEFDRVSVGFPGVITNGVVRTAPNLGTERFKGFDLASAVERRLKKPVQAMNDADVQGYAAARGKGVEMVITLGTGFGSSIFLDGRLGPHMEFAHHPFRKGETYEQQLGDEAREAVGKKRWGKRVLKAIDTLRDLTNFDHIYIGGGNAQKLDVELPSDASIVDNTAGILGGIRLWHDGTGSS
jgi:polyphosphate glucokinase